MKERLLPISILISAVLVLVGLVSLSNTIKNRPIDGTPSIYPSTVVQSAQTPELMSEWEAASYIRFDYESFSILLSEGKLNGTYVEIPVLKTVPDEQAYAEMPPVPDGAPEHAMPVITVPGVERVFVKALLDEWILAQIVP